MLNNKNKIQLYHGDCLELMKNIPDKSINLVIIDPPYNIAKADWDKWKTGEEYINFMGKVFTECQRVLKENGSFYFFHNDFEQMAELQHWMKNNTKFIFKQMLVWNKRFDGSKRKGFFDGFIEVENLRNYQKMAEYCLYYTFQDETGLNRIKTDLNNFRSLRQYFEEYQEALGMTKKEIIGRIGQKADHCFRWKSSQWDMPTKETYEELSRFPLKHKFLRKEYEDLRKEYEDLRYTFNNQKQNHSIMNYEVPKKSGHITPKPVELLEYLIKTSSNEGEMVLDNCMGSGSTGIACINTNRRFIGIEKDDKYFNIAVNRIDKHIKENNLENIELSISL